MEFPKDKADFSGAMADELKKLVDGGQIKILDLLFIKKEADGSFDAAEMHEFEDSDVGILRELGAEAAEILAAEDVDAIAEALEPETLAAVLVWENSWAGPFASSIRTSGGQLVAQGRIPMQAILAAAERTRTDRRRLKCHSDQDEWGGAGSSAHRSPGPLPLRGPPPWPYTGIVAGTIVAMIVATIAGTAGTTGATDPHKREIRPGPDVAPLGRTFGPGLSMAVARQSFRRGALIRDRVVLLPEAERDPCRRRSWRAAKAVPDDGIHD